jgi:hypothetical protein
MVVITLNIRREGSECIFQISIRILSNYYYRTVFWCCSFTYPHTLALTMFCKVIVLSAWTAVDPLTYTRSWDKGTAFWNREFSSSGACECNHAAAYLAPLGLINFIVECVATWQAIKARKIKSEFSESKYILVCLCFQWHTLSSLESQS